MKKLEKKLLEEKQSLEERLNKIAEHYKKEKDQNLEEQAIAEQNEEVVENLGLKLKNRLENVNNALIRMKIGTYGECHECGEKIAKKRLEVLPCSLYCIDCID